MSDSMGKDEKKVIEILQSTDQKLERFVIEQQAGISRTTALNILRKLRAEGKVKRRSRKINRSGIMVNDVRYWLA